MYYLIFFQYLLVPIRSSRHFSAIKARITYIWYITILCIIDSRSNGFYEKKRRAQISSPYRVSELVVRGSLTNPIQCELKFKSRTRRCNVIIFYHITLLYLIVFELLRGLAAVLLKTFKCSLPAVKYTTIVRNYICFHLATQNSTHYYATNVELFLPIKIQF